MKYIISGSKKALTRRWLNQGSPMKENWVDITLDIYKMEAMTARVNDSIDRFVANWEKWTIYVKPMRPDIIFVD